MQGFNSITPFTFCGIFCEFPASVCLICDYFFPHYINDFIKSRTCTNGDLHREYVFPEPFSSRRQNFIKFCMLSVKTIHNNNFRNTLVGCMGPHLFCTHFNTIYGMNNDHRKVGYTDCSNCFADKIHVSRRIKQVKLFPLPIQI